jgi:hypothetical protein
MKKRRRRNFLKKIKGILASEIDCLRDELRNEENDQMEN